MRARDVDYWMWGGNRVVSTFQLMLTNDRRRAWGLGAWWVDLDGTMRVGGR